MEAGLKIINNASTSLIDSSMKNLQLENVYYMRDLPHSVVRADVYNPINNSIDTVYYKANPQQCTLYVLPLSSSVNNYKFWAIDFIPSLLMEGVGVLGFNNYYGGFFFYVPVGVDVGTMKVYTFSPTPTRSNATAGLRVYNANGELTYDSGNRYMRFIRSSPTDIIPSGATKITLPIFMATDGNHISRHWVRQDNHGKYHIVADVIVNLAMVTWYRTISFPRVYGVEI